MKTLDVKSTNQGSATMCSPSSAQAKKQVHYYTCPRLSKYIDGFNTRMKLRCEYDHRQRCRAIRAKHPHGKLPDLSSNSQYLDYCKGAKIEAVIARLYDFTAYRREESEWYDWAQVNGQGKDRFQTWRKLCMAGSPSAKVCAIQLSMSALALGERAEVRNLEKQYRNGEITPVEFWKTRLAIRRKFGAWRKKYQTAAVAPTTGATK